MARNVRVVTGPADDLERRQQLADALTVRSLRPRGPQQGGPVQVKMSPWEGVAQLGEALIAAQAQKAVRKQGEALEEKQRTANAGMLDSMYPGKPANPQAAIPPMLRDPAANNQTEYDPRGTTAQEDPRKAKLAAALQGMDPRQAGSVMSGAMFEQAFREPKIEYEDLGDMIGVLSDGKLVGQLPKGATPDKVLGEQGANARHLTASGSAQLGAQTTMRGQDVSAGTAMRGQDVTMRGQDLSYDAALRGHQATADKYGTEQAKIAEKEAAAKQAGVVKADRMLGTVRSALDMTNGSTAGWMGAATRNLAPFGGAGTDAYTLASTVETIKANLGFDELQQMRLASPTGGALGQVAVQELIALQATIANLDPNQSDDVLRANLEKIDQHYNNWKTTLQGQMPQQPGAAPSPGNGFDAIMQQYLPQQGAQ